MFVDVRRGGEKKKLFVDVRRCSSWVALVAGTCSSMFVDEQNRRTFVDEPKMFVCTLCLHGGVRTPRGSVKRHVRTLPLYGVSLRTLGYVITDPRVRNYVP